jgi:FkbM family methyltransferase
MRVILDVGANTGQNLRYFLDTADKVIAIEADESLCKRIQEEFESEIVENRLKVLNFALVKHDSLEHKRGFVSFYSPKSVERSVLGSLVEPQRFQDFHQKEVPSISIIEIINDHVDKSDVISYCKIDIEGYDQVILEDLFKYGIYPEVLSFECHSLTPVNLVFQSKFYNSFKIVEGASVGRSLKVIQKKRSLEQTEDAKSYEFSVHSSGPWGGGDIPGPWLPRFGVTIYLFLTGPGWKDVHASRVPKRNRKLFPLTYQKLAFKYTLKRLRYKLRLRTRVKDMLKATLRRV